MLYSSTSKARNAYSVTGIKVSVREGTAGDKLEISDISVFHELFHFGRF